MKQRTTYLVSSPEATHPDNFVIESTSLQIKPLQAAREDRFTIGYDELPAQVRNVLSQCSELHIRWSTSKPYATVDPYGSRVPAGLHIFASRRREAVPPICNLLNNAFGVKNCKSLEESFIQVPGGYQFYSPLASIAAFRSYLDSLICSPNEKDCKTRTGSIDSADYIDIKFDAVSQILVANTFWSQPEKPWRETVRPTEGYKNIEVGVLGNEKPMDVESLTLGGFLHVVGSLFLFTFASRHFQFPASYSLTTMKPTGLHPKLQLSISPSLKAPSEDCTLNAYFTLPRALFVDKYQLSSTNPQLLESLNIKRLRGVNGETDLEAPVWGSNRWGSTVLVEIDHLRSTGQGGLNVELPLHLRYLEPSYNSTESTVRFALPSVFWACHSEEWSKMRNSPFDRSRLGWEYLFPDQTMYHHLSPAGDAWKSVGIPVLDLRHAMMVKIGTVAVILGGFLWVSWKIFAASREGKGKSEERVKKTQ
ncbi:PIG-X [Trichophaea hybrida]|nr:PIG-X [Trichophaea hybrida]